MNNVASFAPASISAATLAQQVKQLFGGEFLEVAIHSVSRADKINSCYKQFLPVDFAHSDLAEVKFKRVRLQPVPTSSYNKHDPLLYFVPENGPRPGDLMFRGTEAAQESDDEEQDLPLLPPYSPPTASAVNSALPDYAATTSDLYHNDDDDTSSLHSSGSSSSSGDDTDATTHLADVRISIERTSTSTETYHMHYTVPTPRSPLHSCSDAFDKFARNLLAYAASHKRSLLHRTRVDQVCLYVPEDAISHRLSLKRMGVQGQLDASTGHVVYTFSAKAIDALTTYHS
ncbi:hypothetical protein RI367_006902 [Sorochytrium milnesiophthora]